MEKNRLDGFKRETNRKHPILLVPFFGEAPMDSAGPFGILSASDAGRAAYLHCRAAKGP